MPFDCPANDTLTVLDKAEECLQGGALWMQGYWPNPEGRKCLLAAVKWAMLETGQPFHSAAKFLAEAIAGSSVDHPCATIMAFNDKQGRTFSEIEATLHKAKELVHNAI